MAQAFSRDVPGELPNVIKNLWVYSLADSWLTMVGIPL